MWNRPVVLYAVVWTAGYALAYRLNLETAHPFISIWTLLGVSLLAVVAGAAPHPYGRGLRCLLILILAAGYYQWHELRHSTAFPDYQAEMELSGYLDSPVRTDGDRITFVMRAATARMTGPEASVPGQTGEFDEPEGMSEKVQVSIRADRIEDLETASGWKRGDKLVLRGEVQQPAPARNFGAFEYGEYLRNQGIHRIVQLRGLDGVMHSPGAGPWTSMTPLLRGVDVLRGFMSDRIGLLFGEESAGFMKSLLIGYRSDLDPEKFRQFSRLGLTHIMAISGLHVGVFVASCLLLFRMLGMTREGGLTACMLLLPAYVLLTGAAPSVVRAGLTGMLALYAARRGWLKDGLHLCCMVGLAMLVWNPFYLTQVSFQLSFLVTIGLILGVPRLLNWMPRASVQGDDAARDGMAAAGETASLHHQGAVTAAARLTSRLLQFGQGTLAVTAAAQLVSFPLTIHYFNQYSLLSWLANLLIVPLISLLVLPAGMIALLLGIVFPAAGASLAWLTELLLKGIFASVGYLQGLDRFHTYWPSPSLLWIAGYYGCLAWLAASLSRHRRLLLPGVAVLAALLCTAYFPLKPLNQGEIYFLDVGQGDSALIRTPDHVTVLVDGGGTFTYIRPGEEWRIRQDPYEVGAKLLVPLMRQRGIRHIDYMIATHADHDHIGGLQAVLEQMPVKHLLFNGTLRDHEGALKLLQTALDKGVTVMAAGAGQELELGRHGRISFLHPVAVGGQGNPIPTVSSQNPLSLVFVLRLHDTSALFTGDIELAQEWIILDRLAQAAELLERAVQEEAIPPLPASAVPGLSAPHRIDLMKVAHHGSRTSSSEEWLRYWQPSVSVISAGYRNSYGHPHPSVVERLNARSAILFRTDLQGEIQFRLYPGGSLAVRTKLPPQAAVD